MANLYTKFVTLFQGRLVGRDTHANRYYESRRVKWYGRSRRWVIYAHEDDGSEVPPRYSSWLQHKRDSFPKLLTNDPPWRLEHHGNVTGTPDVWRPDAAYAGGKRPIARSDYKAWMPPR